MRGGELKKVSDLFSKYRERLRAPQASIISEFVEVVSDLMNVDIDSKKVSYAPGSKTLYLKTSGIIRQEILMRKKEILTHLKGRLGEKSAPTDIV